MSVIVLLIILLPVSVFADFGPKPTLSILIKNSKDEACFVTLACDPDTENPDPDKMYLYTDGNIYAYLYKDPSYIATSYVKSNDYFDMKIDSIGYYNITGLGIPYAFNLVLQYESARWSYPTWVRMINSMVWFCSMLKAAVLKTLRRLIKNIICSTTKLSLIYCCVLL